MDTERTADTHAADTPQSTPQSGGAPRTAKGTAKGAAESQAPGWWGAWCHLLSTSAGKDRQTRGEDRWMYARALTAALPQWGNEYIGLALGYDAEAAKGRGRYWRSRLARLGDLDPDAPVITSGIPSHVRAGASYDDIEQGASRNADALPPVPGGLIAALRTCETPAQARRILALYSQDRPLCYPDGPYNPARALRGGLDGAGMDTHTAKGAHVTPAPSSTPRPRTGSPAKSAKGGQDKQGEGIPQLAGWLALALIAAGAWLAFRNTLQGAQSTAEGNIPGAGEGAPVGDPGASGGSAIYGKLSQYYGPQGS